MHSWPRRSKTPPKFHEKTPRETQKERNGGGKGKKKREILGSPPFRGPTFSRSWPHPSGPPTLRAPFLRAPPFGPPLPSSGGPQGLHCLHFFWVWAPTFLIFIMLLICFFCVFLPVSISCFFLGEISRFFFTQKLFFCFIFFLKKKIFSSWGGVVEVSKPKTQTSFQFGGGGSYYSPKLVSSLGRGVTPPPQTSN